MSWAGVCDIGVVNNWDVGVRDVSVGIRGTSEREESLGVLNIPVSSCTKCRTYKVTDLCSVVRDSMRNNDSDRE